MKFKKLPFAVVYFAVVYIALLGVVSTVQADQSGAERAVKVTLGSAMASEPVTGRLFLLITDQAGVEPRQVTRATSSYYFNAPGRTYAPMFGQDVATFQPGASVALAGDEAGYPFKKLGDIPPGEYYVQAVLHRYTQVTPAHGKTIWLPLDHWEGQQFHTSPGNLVSGVTKLVVKDGQGFDLALELSGTIPAAQVSADTATVKYARFKSELASKFWGVDINIGVNVVLPKGYDEHPDAHYPVVFHMGHFSEFTPLRIPTEAPVNPGPGASDAAQAAYARTKKYWDGWMAEDLPRFIAVTLLHPTPFYDDSYLINSPNQGPYQDVLMQEMLPYLEKNFRVIKEPFARVMTGGSTGGWISLYTQATRPDDFGGAWIYCPDWVDFRELMSANVYEEPNMFVQAGYSWLHPERPYSRTVTGRAAVTARQFSHFLEALGSRGRSGEFTDAYAAMFGPVGADGYPVRLWDVQTGVIDHKVAETWRANGFDLRDFLQRNWPDLGPKLKGQLRFLCGDMDQFYANVPMYLIEDFLESTTDPYYAGSFRYGRPKIGHTFDDIGLDPWPFAMLQEMAEHIRQNAPASHDSRQWSYP